MLDATYTLHARTRAQQRSLPPAIINWLLQFGHETRHNGADVFCFDKQSRKRLMRFLGATAFRRIEDLLDAYVVVSDDGQILTVGHRTRRLR